jgi:tubulin--tyrosine ligase-like protein 12
VQTVEPIKANEKIFLIDHAISFRYPDLRKMLENNEKLTIRLSNMLKFWENKLPLQNNESIQTTYEFVQEFENLELEDPLTVEIKEYCVTLSFYSNRIEKIESVAKVLEKYKKIKALWLNDNPIEEKETLLPLIEKEFPNVEILNSKFTNNADEWAFKFVTFAGF